jgi:polyhydroxyalkanoate synthesis regulator phasin
MNMSISPAQLAAFKDYFGFEPDETSLETVKGLVQTVISNEAAADAAGIASKAEAPAAEDVVADTADAPEEDAGATEFVGDMTPDEFRTFMSSIISDAMAGATMKASDPATTNALHAMSDELKKALDRETEVAKKATDLETKLTDLDKRFKALTGEQPRQVAAAYDPTKDADTVVASTAKADVGDPALNDVVGWLIPNRT